jgi:hypothetical protein
MIYILSANFFRVGQASFLLSHFSQVTRVSAFSAGRQNKWDRVWEFDLRLRAASSNGTSASLPTAHPETSKSGDQTSAERRWKKESKSSPGRRASEPVLSAELTEKIHRNSLDALLAPMGVGLNWAVCSLRPYRAPPLVRALRLVTRAYPPESSCPGSGGIPELWEAARECESNGETVVAYFRTSAPSAREAGSCDEETLARALPNVGS